VATLEVFFDVSSPWTYLAFSQIQAMAERTDAKVIWKPILVGGVFNAVNQEVYEQRAAPNPRKAAYMAKDLQDWARHYGLTIKWPSVFPVRAVEVMRTAVIAETEGRLEPFAWAAFEAYWGEDKDISQPEELAALCTRAGLDPAMVAARLGEQSVKDRLRHNTEELVARGGFGSPTLFVDGEDMYFGNDRLPLVEAALKR